MEGGLIALFGGGLVGQWLSKVVGPTLEDFGQDLQTWVRTRRGKNLVDVATRASQIVGDRPVAHISSRVAFPLLMAAANEDSTDLQERWAALLANAAMRPDSVPAAFPHILSQLDSLEVQWLDALDKAWTNGDEGPDPVPYFDLPGASGAEQAMVALTNLVRLSFIQMVPGATIDQLMLRFTPFGRTFVKACTATEPSSS
jgi:hypothetical protein